MKLKFGLAALLAATATFASAQDFPPGGGDIPKDFSPINWSKADYTIRDVMIPMRDGVKLHTVILIPKGAKDAPIVLTRTPYHASARLHRSDSPNMIDRVAQSDEIFAKAGYIRVYQDVRGKYRSEGKYMVTRPPVGPLNPTKVDNTTDAWDTIDWLVDKKNLPQSNGKVGMIGSSYEGFTVAMALLHPHPALKVAVPESPMIDGWMGDDWFHYGAFRLANVGWIAGQTGYQGAGAPPESGGYDDYDNFRKYGGANLWAKQAGYDQLPFWNRLVDHPTYDKFWQGQALDKLLAANPSNVPTLWEQGLWDQEDMYGAIHSYQELVKAGKAGNNYIVMGPWRHSQVNRDGYSLGPFKWNGDTSAQFREDMVLPMFNHYLKGGPAFKQAPATIYNTSENHWDYFKTWPIACLNGCQAADTPIYIQADGGLSFDTGAAGSDSYISDPDKPVPHLSRPVNFGDGRWGTWLVEDQRKVSGRPDVMTYTTPVLTKAVRMSGVPWADIMAKTTGTDVDFVVKVIDVFPEENATDPKMGGYQLSISLDIFRGRYRNSFSDPSPVPANKVQEYKFRLPAVNHVFQPGHRIMVQIQSSLFPAYDRNPQKYVPNIFNAKKSDYQKATITLMRGGDKGTKVWLPVVPLDQSANMVK